MIASSLFEVGWVRIETTNSHIREMTGKVQRETILLAVIAAIGFALLLFEALVRTSHNMRARESEVERTENVEEPLIQSRDEKLDLEDLDEEEE